MKTKMVANNAGNIATIVVHQYPANGSMTQPSRCGLVGCIKENTQHCTLRKHTQHCTLRKHTQHYTFRKHTQHSKFRKQRYMGYHYEHIKSHKF